MSQLSQSLNHAKILDHRPNGRGNSAFLRMSSDHMINESRESVGGSPHLKSQRTKKLSNDNIHVLPIWEYLCYKLGQLSFITNREDFVINWGKCNYKLGRLLQIGATITIYGSYYNFEQNLLQFETVIKNHDSYYKLGHNKRHYHALMIFHKRKINIVAYLHDVKLHICS